MANTTTTKNAKQFRSYPHSSGSKKAADRFRADRDEALEYTASFSTTNRNGGPGNVPSDRSDKETSKSEKYPVKPRGTRSDRRISTVSFNRAFGFDIDPDDDGPSYSADEYDIVGWEDDDED